jgi:hypothetical protein
MRNKDFYFHYRFICRYSLINKFYISSVNTFNISFISSIILYFTIKNLEDLNNLCTSNYFY